jgi:hypothetical protein
MERFKRIAKQHVRNSRWWDNHYKTLGQIKHNEFTSIEAHNDLKKMHTAMRIAFWAFIVATAFASYLASELLVSSGRDSSIAWVFGFCAVCFTGCAMLPFLPNKR